MLSHVGREAMPKISLKAEERTCHETGNPKTSEKDSGNVREYFLRKAAATFERRIFR